MPIRSDIYEIVRQAVAAGLEKVRQAEESKKYVRKQLDFFRMTLFDSGLPHFTVSRLSDEISPKDYSAIFEEGTPDTYQFKVDPTTMESWQRFYELATHDDRLGAFWEIRDSDVRNQDMFHHPKYFDFHKKHRIYGAIASMVDRYVHIIKQIDFDEAKFLPIYLEWESAVFREELGLEVVIPLVCLTFDFDSVRISEDALIERMGDDFQLARNHSRSVTAARPAHIKCLETQ